MFRQPIRCIALGAATLLMALQGSVVAATPTRAASGPITGEDVSWPNCPKGMGIPARPSEGKPMPPRTAGFVVVGLTNGPAFTPNPCLGSQASWATRNHTPVAAYAVVTYPSRTQLARYRAAGPYGTRDTRAVLRNVGWAQATYAVATMRKAGLRSPVVWLDVEVYPVAPWSGSQARNRAVFDGARAAYEKAGYRVGVYSTRYQWRSILGAVSYGLPEWRTAGKTSLTAARRLCSAPSVQGGRSVMAQWWTDTRDHDVLCDRYATPWGLTTYFRRG